MGSDDTLIRNKNGSYILKSQSKDDKKSGICIECGENGSSRDLLYQYNTEDMILVRHHIEDHLIMHPKHKSVTPTWCETCKSLKNYLVNVT